LSTPGYGVHVEDRPGGIRVITLSNPPKRNALDETLLAGLRSALAEPAGVRAILLRGGGQGAFCSGYDLLSLGPGDGPELLPDESLDQTFAAIEGHPAPVIALVTGPTFGAGVELAAACDLRIGATRTVYCMPPARIGVVYSPTGVFRVASLVGRSKARLMFFTGRKVDAVTSERWGLLEELYPTDEAAEAGALSLCRELAENAPLSLSGMKRTFQVLFRPALTEQEDAELRAVRRAAFDSEDAKEGRAAFSEKRLPRFVGK
jgi:enoyl-CoA hydratase/carnithine racemase